MDGQDLQEDSTKKASATEEQRSILCSYYEDLHMISTKQHDLMSRCQEETGLPLSYIKNWIGNANARQKGTRKGGNDYQPAGRPRRISGYNLFCSEHKVPAEVRAQGVSAQNRWWPDEWNRLSNTEQNVYNSRAVAVNKKDATEALVGDDLRHRKNFLLRKLANVCGELEEAGIHMAAFGVQECEENLSGCPLGLQFMKSRKLQTNRLCTQLRNYLKYAKLQQDTTGGVPQQQAPPQNVQQPATAPALQVQQPATAPASLVQQSATAPALLVQQPATAPTSLVQRAATGPAPLFQPAAIAPAPLFQQPTTAPALLVQQPATAPALLVQQPAIAPAPLFQQPATAPALLVQQPATAPALLVQQPATAPALLVQPPVTAPASLVQQPASASALLVSQPATAPTLLVQQPTTAPAPLVQQPATGPASLVQQPATAHAPLVHQPATAPGLLVQQPATAPALLVQQPATAPAPLVQRAATGPAPLVQRAATGPAPLVQRAATGPAPLVQRAATGPAPLVQRAATGPAPLVQRAATGPAPLVQRAATGPAPLVQRAATGPAPLVQPAAMAPAQLMMTPVETEYKSLQPIGHVEVPQQTAFQILLPMSNGAAITSVDDALTSHLAGTIDMPENIGQLLTAGVLKMQPGTISKDAGRKKRKRKADPFLGKEISHLWDVEDPEGRPGTKWYKGEVFERNGDIYNIRYEDQKSPVPQLLASLKKAIKGETLFFL